MSEKNVEDLGAKRDEQKFLIAKRYMFRNTEKVCYCISPPFYLEALEGCMKDWNRNSITLSKYG